MRSLTLGIETERNILNRAFKISFAKFKIPKEEQKAAKKWNNVRQDVSKQMSSKLVGRPVPIINRGIKPTNEVLRMTFTSDLPKTIYPRQAKNNTQKFQILRKLLLKGELKFPMFKEYAESLNITDKTIQKTVNQALNNLF